MAPSPEGEENYTTLLCILPRRIPVYHPPSCPCQHYPSPSRSSASQQIPVGSGDWSRGVYTTSLKRTLVCACPPGSQLGL